MIEKTAIGTLAGRPENNAEAIMSSIPLIAVILIENETGRENRRKYQRKDFKKNEVVKRHYFSRS